MLQPDKIIRSERKTLSVCIDCFGNVTVRAPKRCDEARIFAFLQAKEAWILRKKAERTGVGTALPPENLDGYVFSLLGKDCTLRLYDGDKITFDREKNEIFLPYKNARERLIKWLKENAKRILTQWTEQTARRMQTSYQSVAITSAKTRWGSCSGDNKIRYTFRLLYAPREIIEYVTVHELAHTKHKNHSKAFWREVERFEPQWKQKRKWLKMHGVFMQIF